MHSPHGHSHHDHAHSHGHATGPNDSRRTLSFLFILNLLYMFAEIIGGMLSGSLALLADAGHMAIDVFAIALSIFAMWIALKPPTLKNTYGFQRAEILAALVNGATLVAISVWIIYEAVVRFQRPVPVEGEVMTGVALGGLVVNLFGLVVVYRQRRDNLNIRGVWLHVLTDALGSAAALIGGLFVWKLGWQVADPAISIAISLLILYGSWHLVSDCVNVLLEGSPRGIDVGEIEKGLKKLVGVSDVHDLHVWTVSSGLHALSAHVSVAEKADHGTVLATITTFLKDHFQIEHVTVQLEPPSFSHSKLRV
jgi:cobalt-zinc-cadmium efflux system protein